MLGDETLFTLVDRLGPFSAEDRAIAASRRLAELTSRNLAEAPSLTVVASDEGVEIRHGSTVLLVVTEDDAAATRQNAQALAERYAEIIAGAVGKERRSVTLRTVLLGVLFTVLATAALIFLLRLLARAFPAIVRVIDSWRGTVIPSLRIQNFELISADRIADLALALIRLTRLFLIVVAFYIYIPLVFGFFPWTRNLSRTIFGYVLSPLNTAWKGMIAFLPNLFFIAVIAVLTYYGLRVLHAIFREVERGAIALPNFDKDWAEPTFKIVRFLVLAFAVVVAFPYLPGSDSPAFRGVSLFLGVLFSLGSSSAIANIVAGVILTYTGAFKIGDRVKIADTMGDVLEKTLLVTRVRTVKNVEITVPNAMVLGSHIINFSAAVSEHRGLILHSKVTIGYDVPWRQVHELLIAAANRTSGILPQPEPFVLQLSLDDYYPSYEINAYTDNPSAMARVYSDLHQNIQDVFNEAGVEILSPAYSAVRDGNQVTIPQSYLPASYQAPAFRILPIELLRTIGRSKPPGTASEQPDPEKGESG